MAILLADGFEDGAEADYPASNTSISAGNGRRGGKALNIASSSGWFEVFNVSGSPSTLFVHIAVNPSTVAGTFLSLREGSTIHVGIRREADGSILAFRSSTSSTLGSSAAGVMPSNVYTSIQVKVVIHDTAGSVEVRVNGSSTPVLNLTGVDTRNASTGVISNLTLAAVTGGLGDVNAYYDDLVIWDTTGSVNNTWLGDLRVDSYLPTADGDTTTLTTSTGTSHFALVDEVPSSGTDYVQSATVGNKDLFQMADMSHTPLTIHAVIPVANLLKDDAGAREMALVVKSGATESDGANFAPSTASVKYARVIETDPNGGGAWTKAAFDALQVGVKVTV